MLAMVVIYDRNFLRLDPDGIVFFYDLSCSVDIIAYLCDNGSVKPFQTYNGGKESAGTFQKIINEIRPCDILIIPFLGNCAVTRRMKRPEKVIGLDLDKKVIEAWQRSDFEIELINACGIDYLKQVYLLFPNKQICIYIDPPYLMETRKSKRKLYTFELEENEHKRLISAVQSLAKFSNIDILISHYPCKLYDLSLKGWRKMTFNSTTHNGVALEGLYMNFSHTDGKLQDYSYIGGNKDERYNLKHRTAKNLIAKLERMEARKKQAVLYYLREWLSAVS